MTTYNLIAPTILQKYVIDGLRIPNVIALTVYGSDSGLTAAECPATSTLTGQQYVFYGGHSYTTTDPHLVTLWLAAGGTVS